MLLGIAFILGIQNILIENIQRMCMSCTFAAVSGALYPTSLVFTISGAVSFVPITNEMKQVVWRRGLSGCDRIIVSLFESPALVFSSRNITLPRLDLYIDILADYAVGRQLT
ncbi:hypothetical protein AVEN_226357-1 [Araneus ventricosus]|uniref:Uncharacterized protein n=1 Tax=Araneus ventricosus TaxID=182803 RepID=A0A4Y2KWC1_ARAVE|nr:hypothetical protein AVEN_226357-1 [Araneus ventricosus]